MIAPIPDGLGEAPMPVMRASGRFVTLLNSDRYLVAAVAYQSWPGSCLVQGFAVKIGSDELLARKVIDRWLSEMAPALVWRRRLREQPPFENR